MKHDTIISVWKCDKCYWLTPIPKAPPKNLIAVMSPWLFGKWGIDLFGPLHTFPCEYKFVVVAIDYYTKWVKAKPFASITEANCTNFIWKNIICWFGIPHSLVIDSGNSLTIPRPSSSAKILALTKSYRRSMEISMVETKGWEFEITTNWNDTTVAVLEEHIRSSVIMTQLSNLTMKATSFGDREPEALQGTESHEL